MQKTVEQLDKQYCDQLVNEAQQRWIRATYGRMDMVSLLDDSRDSIMQCRPFALHLDPYRHLVSDVVIDPYSHQLVVCPSRILATQRTVKSLARVLYQNTTLTDWLVSKNLDLLVSCLGPGRQAPGARPRSREDLVVAWDKGRGSSKTTND